MDQQNLKNLIKEYDRILELLGEEYHREALDYFRFFLTVHPLPLWSRFQSMKDDSPIKNEWLAYTHGLEDHMEQIFCTAYALGQLETLHINHRIGLLAKALPHGEYPFPARGRR